MWVNRHKLNNSLVVFMHGIFGSAAGTWRDIIELIQDRTVYSPLLASYDAYLFEYRTVAIRQPSLFPTVVSELQQFIEQQREKYRTIVFVCHSQGGLLGKLYVLDQLQNRQGQSLLVDLIITLGTPHHGRLILNPLLLLKSTPLLGKVIPLRQLAQLASRGGSIRRLNEHWKKHVSAEPCPTTPTVRHIRTFAMVGAFDQWVSEESASALSDTVRHVTADHGGVKPKATERAAKAVFDMLEGHQRPADVLNEILRLRADVRAYEQYLGRCGPRVIEYVRQLRPHLPQVVVPSKAAILLRDFLDDFPARPLRALAFDNAVYEYAHRQLSGER